MNTRNTIQRDMVLKTVRDMKSHVTADQVYNFIHEHHPSIGKGTVYRNLNILAHHGDIKKIEIPNGPDRFDHTTKPHYHVRCVECGEVMDVDMEFLADLQEHIRNPHGIVFLGHDILFQGICPACQEKDK